MSYDLIIDPILDDGLDTPPPLMPVVVADLESSKKDIDKLYRLTKVHASVELLKHLRRVRYTKDGRIECILAHVNGEDSTQKLISKLEESIGKEGIILKDCRIVKVPSIAAKTKVQLDSYSRIWPVKYSKNEFLVKCIEGSIIDDAERLVARIITNGLLDYFSKTESSYSSAAVIFRYAQIYGVGLSCCAALKENPTKHSPMMAIDMVSANAGAGHWPAECHSDGKVLAGKLQGLLEGKPELKDHVMEPDFSPYICTNYDIVITEEPCMMCTMGLIQSRIRRLFYLDTKQLLTLAKCSSIVPVCYPDKAVEEFLVHRNKSINHRFEAWRIKLLARAS